MWRSGIGEKRPRDTGPNSEPLKFIPGLTLSQHPLEQRKGLFMKKLNEIIKAKRLHPTEFKGYTIRERFKRMGWEQLLDLKCDKIYPRVVIQWMATLSRNGDELTGIVNGKSYTITPEIIRDVLGVDTRKESPYVRFNEADFQAATDENRRRWLEACKTVFGVEKNANEIHGYEKSKMTPLVKVLWHIGVYTFHPRYTEWFCGSIYSIYPREIYLLHALVTGNYLYSFAHLMIYDIWDMYEHECRRDIPHGYYISEILNRLGAVSEDEFVEHVSPKYCVISSRDLFMPLYFSESPTEYIIDDEITGQRVTFPKKIMKEAQPQPTSEFSQSTRQYMPPQMPIPSSNTDMTKLFSKLQKLNDKQSSKFHKLHDEMKLDMQKQIENQALEAECREQEREKRAEERELERARQAERREQEREKQAKERELGRTRQAQKRELERAIQAEKKEQEREKRAEEKEQERVAHAEKREQEREKRAEERERQADIRAHAIIWDIERQRYFYEKEQEQLRMAWNQVNGADEFHFPQISHTSFHPPRQGSPYYDPAQGDKIPKAFQSLYQDIYGPIHKKPPAP